MKYILSDIPGLMRESLEGLAQIGRIVSDLRSFAHPGRKTRDWTDINACIESALTIAHNEIKYKAEVVRDLAELPPVMACAQELNQVFLNLLVNAAHAIDAAGEIHVTTRRIDGHVEVRVQDTGSGIPDDIRPRIFEPFFTTKDVDKGTGLGLATVYGIVKQNNGFVNVYSEPGQGTTFKIYLPRHAAKTARETEKHPPQAMGRGRETILLVEDEPSILRMTRMMLERIGYKVLSAGTPGEAIALAREHAGEIHLLMTDVVMPEMNGRELARNLLSLYPNIKRLFMSGYTANVIAHHGVLEPGVQFIQKPFAKDKLATKVREALEES